MEDHDQRDETDNHPLEELLLDFHLNRVGDQDRVSIERELERDEELRNKSDRLARVLRPLDHWTVGSPPEKLIERTLDRIAQTQRERTSATLWHAEDGASAVGAGSEPGLARRAFPFRLRDVLATAACIGLLASVVIPSLAAVRERAQRSMCANNLGSIFQGTRLYQASYAGSLPFAGFSVDASWLPGGAGANGYASNSRHMFLPVKLNYGPKPEHFICPSNPSGTPMRADDLANYDDFSVASNNSYDSLNLSGAIPNLRPATAIAYVSDRNPLFRRGRFDASIDPNRANSRAHRGRGQIVLTLDGTAQWMTSPIYGASKDNLWLIRGVLRYTGVETLTQSDDAQLVPGYPRTDPDLRKLLQH